MLQKYNEVLPGAAERIVSMAESQGNHRRELEARVIESDIKSSVRGQWFGFVLGSLGLTAGFVLGLLGRSLAGSVVAGTSLVSLVSVFVIGSLRRSRERLQKYGKDVL